MSFPVMYQYLEPAGLIMKLNPEPVTLTDEMAARDRQYWDSYTKRVTAHPDYAHDKTAQNTFAKMRSAIGGLYVAHNRFDDAEYAFRQAIALGPRNPEANLRIVQEVYLRLGRFADARAVLESYVSVCTDDYRAQAESFMKSIYEMERGAQRRQALESLMATGKASATNAVELAGIYLKLGQIAQFEALSKGILASTNLSTEVCRQLADVCTNATGFPMADDIRKRALKQASAGSDRN